jgi:hypothetical protein
VPVDPAKNNDATSKEDSDVQQLENDLAQNTTADEQNALEDAIRKCLLQALGQLAASVTQGQTPDFVNGLAGSLFSCMKAELLGTQNANTENEEAVETLANDLTGQVDEHANEVAEAGATPGELATWLTNTANSLPGGSQPTSTTAAVAALAGDQGGSSHGSSFPWLWIVVGVVVVGGGIALASK